MCECGCGDGDPLFQFPGPKGSIYAFHVYPGCSNCEAPAGIILVKYKNKKEAAMYGGDELPQMPFRDSEFDLNNPTADRSEFVMVMVEPKKIIKNLLSLCGDAVIGETKVGEEPFTVKELLTDVETEEAERMVFDGVVDSYRSFVKILEKDKEHENDDGDDE